MTRAIQRWLGATPAFLLSITLATGTTVAWDDVPQVAETAEASPVDQVEESDSNPASLVEPTPATRSTPEAPAAAALVREAAIEPTETVPAVAPKTAATPEPLTAPAPPTTSVLEASPVSKPTAKVTTIVGPAEVLRQHYPNGKLMLEREVSQDAAGNYINHGKWKMWDQDGKVIVSGRCRNNELHGTWSRTYRGTESRLFQEPPYNEFKAPYLSVAQFQDGLLQGTWLISDSEGRKISSIEFVDGQRHGTAIWWYASGQKMLEQHFQTGIVHGDSLIWKPTGEVAVRETFIEGRQSIPQTEKHSNGQKKSEAVLLLPMLTLQHDDDWWHARLAKYEIRGEAIKHGTVTTWYANGTKESQAQYDVGVPIADHLWWYENGQKAAEGRFEDGEPHGTWNWWHRNGQKAISGDYAKGVATGIWTLWKSDGQLASRVNAGAEGEELEPTAEIASPPSSLQKR